MKKNSFPLGVVITLGILWLGLAGVVGWGWWTLQQVTTPGSASSTAPDSGASTAPGSVSSTAPVASPAPGAGDRRLVFTQEGLWRFSLKAGGAALVAILFLLLAVGAGVLVQEKSESLHE